MIAFTANTRCARAVTDDAITTDSVGIPVYFQFSPEWEDTAKIAVFKAGNVAVDVALTGDNTVLPPEVLTTAGERLFIGVYGANGAGTVVIPTIWADVAILKPGAVPSGVDPASPTPSWVAQVQEIAAEALAHMENMTVSASGLPAGSAPTASWDAGTDVLSLGIPKGDKGDKGDTGADGQTGATPDIFTTAVTLSPGSSAYAHTSGTLEQPLITFGIPRGADGQDGKDGEDGAPGQDGAPGVGVPTGGTTGQVLAKKSGTDYDTEWVNQSGGGGGAVDSVNGKTGTVVLDADDVGALPDDTVIPTKTSDLENDSGFLTSAPVSSVNGQTGAVSLGKSDVGLGNVDNVQQYSATNPPPYPVTSVNGSTGAVSLSIPSSASDVGAVAVAQGVGHSGEFLVVGSDGNVTTITLATWQGGSY